MAGMRKFKSDAFEAVHSTAVGMYRVGTIDKATMREFDETCLTVTPPRAPAARSGKPGPRSRVAPRSSYSPSSRSTG